MDDYTKIMRDEITSKHVSCGPDPVEQNDKEAAAIATQLGLAERIEAFSDADAFGTIKAL